MESPPDMQNDAVQAVQEELDHVTALPEGVLLRILAALDSADLPAAEATSERLRAAVQAGRLYRAACLREVPGLERFRTDVSEVPTFGGDASGESLPHDAAESPASSAFHKK